MNPINLLLWLHIVCMISVIGTLLSTQLCTTAEYRNSPDPSRAIARLANILLGVGFLAGLTYYILIDGMSRGAHYNGVVAMKFIFLLGTGALLGISKKTDRGDGLRWIAFGLMLAASLFGITLS